jgi:hypothetical protein
MHALGTLCSFPLPSLLERCDDDVLCARPKANDEEIYASILDNIESSSSPSLRNVIHTFSFDVSIAFHETQLFGVSDASVLPFIESHPGML